MTVLIPLALEHSRAPGNHIPLPSKHTQGMCTCVSSAPGTFHPSHLSSFLVQICNVDPQVCDFNSALVPLCSQVWSVTG